MAKYSNLIMSEFFLELFSEEIPANLQKNSREILQDRFIQLFQDKQIIFKKSAVYSTPNRLIVFFDGLNNEITQKAEEIKGPNISAPEKAIEGFLRSNEIDKKDLFKKEIEKGEFYFFKKSSKKMHTIDLLQKETPIILDSIQWKKSMRWGSYNLSWGRPLKSILATFGGKSLNFKFHHLKSSNTTFIDKEFEDKKKKPNILLCKFDKKFLDIPKEILIITMQYHQKYFPTFDRKNNITNEFLVVANNKDIKGFIKLGNERVVEARLSDAQFFWEKNKSQNLVKQVSKLKTMSYFKGLGSYFDKIQRMRKLGGVISDELLISKEKVELSASIFSNKRTLFAIWIKQ